jgi:hypothetical protein
MLSGDTAKVMWTSPTAPSDIQINDRVTNNNNFGTKVKWVVTAFFKDAGWNFGGFCDNHSCYGSGTDPLSPVLSGTSDLIPAKTSADAHAFFNGDAAAKNTKAYITVVFTDTAFGGSSATATYYAYKDATGVVTITRSDDGISIYPNPAQNYIDVRYSSNDDVKNIAIYNLIGKLVSVYRVSSNTSAHCEFNDEMPSGIYLARITDSRGNIIATRKFTRQ